MKDIVLWVRKICWAICFHLHSPDISLQKNKFLGRHFKKIMSNHDFFLKLKFTPCKAEQPLQDMELQEKEAQKD